MTLWDEYTLSESSHINFKTSWSQGKRQTFKISSRSLKCRSTKYDQKISFWVEDFLSPIASWELELMKFENISMNAFTDCSLEDNYKTLRKHFSREIPPSISVLYWLPDFSCSMNPFINWLPVLKFMEVSGNIIKDTPFPKIFWNSKGVSWFYFVCIGFP